MSLHDSIIDTNFFASGTSWRLHRGTSFSSSVLIFELSEAVQPVMVLLVPVVALELFPIDDDAQSRRALVAH